LGTGDREQTPVIRIDARRSRITTIRTPGAVPAPRKVVLACGPRSHKAATFAGQHFPIQPT
jgi:hypothetical protein